MSHLEHDLRLVCLEAEAFAEAILTHPDADGLQLDPLLLVQYLSMVTEAGCSVPRLRKVGGLVADQVKALPERQRSSGRIGHLARLLAKERFSLSLKQTQIPEIPDGEKLILMSSDAIQELVHDLSVLAAPLPESSAELLSLLALSELREYRLDCGLAIMRFLVRAGWENEYLSEAISFVAIQRTVSGSYGFVNPLLEDGLNAAEREQKLNLPNTLNVVWLFKLIVDGRYAEAPSL